MKEAVTLKKNHEFRRMYKKAASSVGPFVVVYCRKNRLGRNRLGMTVSTKLGKAVVRNRVRRRLREIFRLNGDKLTLGWDIILVARGRCVGATYGELDRDFLRQCVKLTLLRENP